LQGHNHRVCCRHGIDRQEAERRRAIDQHIRVAGVHRGKTLQCIAQAEIAPRLGDELKLGAREIDRGGNDVQPGNAGGHDGVRQRRADQDIIGGDIALVTRDAESGRGVALRVEVDDEDGLAHGGKRRSQIDRRGGLAHAALLIGHDQHARFFPLRGRMGFA